jgi:bifunctional DNA-binding transcriptional regulator/antitoxin component of YhaV-PrlF toxin-antitoxin module
MEGIFKMKKNSGVEKSVTERSVVNINGTLYVSIPKAFADRHSIRPGDRLPMILDGSQLKIIPHEKE